LPDTAEVVMTYNVGDGRLSKNVFNVREGSILEWDPTTLNLLIDTFEDWEENTAKSLRSTSCILTGISARNMTEEDSYIVERPLTIAGTVGNPILPANVTFCLKGGTGLAGRSFRSRHYWIGMCENQVVGQTVELSLANGALAAIEQLATDLSFGSRNLVVVSRYHDNAPRETAVITDITSWSYTDRIVDTQRRRLHG